MAEETVSRLDIGLLIPNPYQPRKKFDENSIKELALSIREYGILNPILVRKKDDKYEIIAGERRYRAAKLLNMKEVPAIIKDISDEKMIEVALIENLQRENITPIEEAMTYQEILKKTSRTEKELSEIIGKSQPFISNKLRLLNLPQNIQTALIDKKISERHARSLLTVKDEAKQTELLERIIREKLSVKDLDNIINEKEITEEEINSAVDNIMNSLKESDNEKKEEKESDNMNNGNFFPNFNNGQDANNTNASLNSMNMQTMGGGFTYNPEGQAPAPEAAPVAPAPMAPAAPEAAPVMPQMEMPVAPAPAMEPTPELPQMNSEPVSPIPDFNTAPAEPMPAVEVAPMAPNPPEINGDVAPVADIPLFNSPDFNQPVEVAPAPVMEAAPVAPEPVAPVVPEAPAVEPLLTAPEAAAPVEPMPEAPIFNQELAAPAPEAAYSVPVATEEPAAVDKFTQVKELLNNNGIEYKAYSNETGNCIVIEC